MKLQKVDAKSIPKAPAAKTESKPTPTPKEAATKLTVQKVKPASQERPKPVAKINKSLELKAKSAPKEVRPVVHEIK